MNQYTKVILSFPFPLYTVKLTHLLHSWVSLSNNLCYQCMCQPDKVEHQNRNQMALMPVLIRLKIEGPCKLVADHLYLDSYLSLLSVFGTVHTDRNSSQHKKHTSSNPSSREHMNLTLKVLITTIDAQGHFET